MWCQLLFPCFTNFVEVFVAAVTICEFIVSKTKKLFVFLTGDVPELIVLKRQRLNAADATATVRCILKKAPDINAYKNSNGKAAEHRYPESEDECHELIPPLSQRTEGGTYQTISAC